MGSERENRYEKPRSEVDGIYSEVFQKFPYSIALVDTKTGNISKINDAFLQFTGYKKEDLINKDAINIGIINQEDKDKVQNLIDGKGEFFDVEMKFRNISGEEKTGLITGQKIEMNNESYYMYTIVDTTYRKQEEERICYLGLHDSLTGLYNRAFVETEAKRLDTPRQLPLSIMMFDIDGLKMTNDVFGHSEGDNLLKTTAEVFRQVFRSEDIIARVGGDEFVTLLPNVSKDETEKIIQRIREKCISVTNLKIPLNISIGTATKEQKNQNIKEKIKEAEDKMYKSKIQRKDVVIKSIMSSLETILRENKLETEAHISKVKEYSLKLGKALNLSDDAMENLSLLASVHDIGKVAISEDLLNKNDKLTEKEQEEIKSHTQKGYNIIKLIPSFSPILGGILSCHENWDGSGYPDGKKEDEIPLASRIVFLADSFDIMTRERPYKKAMTEEQSIVEIERCSGRQFDPMLVEKFVEVLKKENESNNGRRNLPTI